MHGRTNWLILNAFPTFFFWPTGFSSEDLTRHATGDRYVRCYNGITAYAGWI